MYCEWIGTGLCGWRTKSVVGQKDHGREEVVEWGRRTFLLYVHSSCLNAHLVIQPKSNHGEEGVEWLEDCDWRTVGSGAGGLLVE